MTEVSGYAHEGFWKTAWKKDTNEDEACAVVRFKKGTRLQLTITHIDSNPKAGMLEITGTKGSYIMDGGKYTLIQNKAGKVVQTTGKNPPGEYELAVVTIPV